jgi:hypothetical protein
MVIDCHFKCDGRVARSAYRDPAVRNDKLLFTNYYVFAVPTRFVRLIAHAVLSTGLNSLEEKMAGAGAPGGLPLICRFFPGLFGQDSSISRWRTLILVTPAKAGAMRCLFLGWILLFCYGQPPE